MKQNGHRRRIPIKHPLGDDGCGLALADIKIYSPLHTKINRQLKNGADFELKG